MLIVLRHIHPLVADIAGVLLGVAAVVYGATTGTEVFVVSGAVSLVLGAARFRQRSAGTARGRDLLS
jgi:hypothetical protein